MFEQTLLDTSQSTRKPYSMVLSLILQIMVLGVLCVIPLIFTQVLPMMQMKSVLAAPPRPPAPAVKVRVTSAAQTAPSPTRVFRILDLKIRPVTAMPHTPVKEMEDAPAIGVDGGIPNGDPGGIIGMIGTGPAPKPPVPPAPKPNIQKTVRIGTMSSASIIRMVQPPYPKMARDTRVEGTVEFTATISKEGTIENLALVHGHPLLVKAAQEAVLQWRYRPTMLNGEPVEVITDILVNFRLNQ